MYVNCYYYAPHNHSLLIDYLRTDLDRMISMGCDAVSVCVQEEQMTNWHQARLHNVVNEAHLRGLHVHAVPNRWAGILAGWLDGHAEWTLEHTELLAPGREHQGMADVRHPQVRDHYAHYIRMLLEEFEFDGIIWDEPRPAQPEVIMFLDEMSKFAKSITPQVTISCFAEAGNLHLAESLAATAHMDYLGADGHIRGDDHQMHRMKNTIFTTHQHFHPILTSANKKTMYLPEAQRHRDEDYDEYMRCLESAFSLPMDQLLFYYSAHELSPNREAGFNHATWNMVRQLKGKPPASAR